jgi:hypothetical protein
MAFLDLGHQHGADAAGATSDQDGCVLEAAGERRFRKGEATLPDAEEAPVLGRGVRLDREKLFRELAKHGQSGWFQPPLAWRRQAVHLLDYLAGSSGSRDSFQW